MPSLFEVPEDELTDDQRKLKTALVATAQAQEQAAADRAVTAHLNNRVVALRAQLNEALETITTLEARRRPGAAGAGKKAAATPDAKPARQTSRK